MYLVYVEMSPSKEETARLRFSLSGSSATRQWDIKVAQIPCGAITAPPSGCLQFSSSMAGRFKTFNFDATNSNHLPNQRQ